MTDITSGVGSGRGAAEWLMCRGSGRGAAEWLMCRPVKILIPTVCLLRRSSQVNEALNIAKWMLLRHSPTLPLHLLILSTCVKRLCSVGTSTRKLEMGDGSADGSKQMVRT